MLLVVAAAAVLVVVACAAVLLVLRSRLDAVLDDAGAAEAVLADVTLPLLGIGAGLLLATCLLGVLAVHRTLRPVAVMVERASRASAAGDLPVPPGRDEMARLAVTLNAVLSRMRAAVTRERALVAGVGQELRAPLAALRGEIELARTSTTYDDLQGSLAAADHEVSRLGSLTDDLLLVAREGAAADEQPGSSVEPAGTALRPTDLRTLVPDELRRLSAMVPRTSLSLDDSGVGGVTALVAGPDSAWARVLAHLVRDAGAAGAGHAVVRLATTADEVSLVVDDDGRCFAGADSDHPGSSAVDGDGQQPGGELPEPSEPTRRAAREAGLGLVIIDALVRARRGRVRLDAGPEGGARVSVSVPLARPAAGQGDGGGHPA